jgi:hypothetical protein
MLKKNQPHCTSNLKFADVLHNGYMDRIMFPPKLKYHILKNTRTNVKFEEL